MTFVMLSSAAFALGLYGVLTRRDVVAVLASVEIMLGSATVLLVGMGSMLEPASGAPFAGIEAIALLVIVVAAAEASVGLALLVAVARRLGTTRVDELTEVNG